MDEFGLHKEDRIYLKNDFKIILKEGKKVFAMGTILWCRLNPGLIKPRVGIIVSRKSGGAVQRNRCKRFFRESFRLNRHLLVQNADCIFYPRDFNKLGDIKAVRAAFGALAKKANIWQAPPAQTLQKQEKQDTNNKDPQ